MNNLLYSTIRQLIDQSLSQNINSNHMSPWHYIAECRTFKLKVPRAIGKTSAILRLAIDEHNPLIFCKNHVLKNDMISKLPPDLSKNVELPNFSFYSKMFRHSAYFFDEIRDDDVDKIIEKISQRTYTNAEPNYILALSTT